MQYPLIIKEDIMYMRAQKKADSALVNMANKIKKTADKRCSPLKKTQYHICERKKAATKAMMPCSADIISLSPNLLHSTESVTDPAP